jgi:hypothetical protein
MAFRSQLEGTPIAATDNRSDNILFTLIDIFAFTVFLLVPAVCSDSLGQFEQIHHSEQRPTRSHNHERIHGNGIGPTCWHRLNAAVIVVKPNSVFAPVLTKRHRFEFLLKGRMIGMGYSETSTFTVALWRI